MKPDWNTLIPRLAKIAHNSQFEDEWDDLPENGIERAIWQQTVTAVVNEIRIIMDEITGRDENMSASREMPKYRSHKEVWALKIAKVEDPGSPAHGSDGSRILTPEDDGYAPFRVDDEYCRKHDPKAGGYYVVYEGGYKSWSPAEAFEDGYTVIS